VQQFVKKLFTIEEFEKIKSQDGKVFNIDEKIFWRKEKI